jgi:CBS domain-containing membrane protein
MGALSILLSEPLLIPAVGGSVYMVLSAPEAETSAPKNVLVGHAVADSVGWLALSVFGLHGVPGGQTVALTWTRLAAVAVSLALTNAVLRAIRCSHGPAGASTMIVSIGALPEAHHILDFELAAFVTVVYGVFAHRLSGIEYSLRRVREPS